MVVTDPFLPPFSSLFSVNIPFSRRPLQMAVVVEGSRVWSSKSNVVARLFVVFRIWTDLRFPSPLPFVILVDQLLFLSPTLFVGFLLDSNCVDEKLY